MKKKSNLLILSIIIIIVTLFGCTESYEDDDVKYLMGVALQKMQEDITKKDEIVVIDIRPKEEYDLGHVKHAVNIPEEELDNKLKFLKNYKEDPIILYGDTAEQAEKLGKKFVDSGFLDVNNADGVKEYEYPFFTYDNLFPNEMLEKVEDKTKLIIDARPEEAYKEGHIKGAINIPLDEFEDKKDIIPSKKDVDITVYCFKGNNSSALAQKLVELGYNNVSSQLYGTMEYDYDLVK